jgi:hypothetical protein
VQLRKIKKVSEFISALSAAQSNTPQCYVRVPSSVVHRSSRTKTLYELRFMKTVSETRQAPAVRP